MPAIGFSQSNISSLFLAFTIGAVLSYFLFTKTSSGHQQNQQETLQTTAITSAHRRNHVDKAFYLGVVVTFPNAQEKENFLTIFKPLAKYVKEKEFGTLSYELLYSDKDNKRILISERYQSKEYYLNVHKTSTEFLTFREKFQQIITDGAVVDGHSYNESGIGFV